MGLDAFATLVANHPVARPLLAAMAADLTAGCDHLWGVGGGLVHDKPAEERMSDLPGTFCLLECHADDRDQWIGARVCGGGGCDAGKR